MPHVAENSKMKYYNIVVTFLRLDCQRDLTLEEGLSAKEAFKALIKNYRENNEWKAFTHEFYAVDENGVSFYAGDWGLESCI